jgi:hypothetical protein
MSTTLPNGYLKIEGNRLVDGEGRAVVLRGFGLGGWMNMENFITGYPANEEAQRQALLAVLGPAKYELFFDRFLTYFFTEADARFIKSLGLNLVRIPVNYRHFEDDMQPFVVKDSCFAQLDRVIDLCAAQGIHTIIDLHAVPGYQNQDWHSDNPTHKALLWQHKHFQDRTVNLWEAFATHYRDNPWVAGYNPINEPYDPSEQMIVPLYRRLVDAIRAIDPYHLIFLEGNRYSQDFHMFGEPWPGVVYTNHDYADPGFVDGEGYPGLSRGKYYDNEVLEETFLRRSQYMLDHNLPIWVGEFGPVYTGDPATDAWRYRLLQDQLAIYQHHGVSWSIWLYKDIGLQAVTYAAPNSPWIRRLQPLLAKKARLGADCWGSRDTDIRGVMGPLEGLVAAEFPAYEPNPFGAGWQIRRLVRHILLSEALLPEFGALFAGVSEAEIDELQRSFLFENCSIRQELAQILSRFAR